jgi:Icc protein
MSSHWSRRQLIRYGLAGLTSACVPACAGSTGTRSSGQPDLQIVFYSDVHARREWDTPLALEQAAEAINATKPDLVLGGGDLITDGFESAPDLAETRWAVYNQLPQAIKAEHHSAIGNHDLVAVIPKDGSAPSADPRAAFRRHLGVAQTYNSFDAAGYHFMLLDSIQILGFPSQYQGLIDAKQLQWIKDDLSSVNADTPIVVVLHIPLLTTLYQATEGATASAPPGRVVVNNRDVLNAFTDHNLTLVLQGHLHITEMMRWRNTTFITGGALSGKWWRGRWYDTDAGFCSITLRDGQIDWEYITYGWEPRRPATA